MKSRADIVVVGGGPSGLHAARSLAHAGFSVTVLEEHEALGDPVHCTGILAAQTFNEFDIPRPSILNELRTVGLFSPSGNHVSYTTPKTEAVVIDRRHFDQELSRAVDKAGVEILRGARVTGIDIEHDKVLIKTASGANIACSCCVLACGANYGLHLRLGLGLPQLYMNSAQIEVRAGSPQDVEIHLGSGIAPGGFGWTVPVERSDGSYCRIGLMCDGDADAYFPRMIDRVASRWKAVLDDRKPRIKMLPLGPVRKTFLDRLLVIGDAAGRVKPTTGGGIYYSLVSAQLAAEVLSHAFKRGDLSACGLQLYETLWRERTESELNAQMTLRNLLQHLSDSEIDEFVELAKTDGILPLVRKTARFNEHREFISALLRHPEAGRILFRRIAGALTR